MAGIGLTKVFRVLSEQANKEIDPAELPVAQPGQPGPDFRLQFHLVEAAMHLMLYAFDAMTKLLDPG